MAFDVTLHPGESQESLLRRFQKMVQTSGILKTYRARQRFMSKRDAYLAKAKKLKKRWLWNWAVVSPFIKANAVF